MAGRLRCEPPGILSLVLLIEQHQAAFDYDWRSRFHLPAAVIGHEMPWDEAVRLGNILRADPGSMIAASLEGWSHPISRTEILLLDQFDLHMKVNSAKPPKPHWMRPGSREKKSDSFGDRAGRTNAQVLNVVRPPI